MSSMPQTITSSLDLARLLNACPPLTAADAADTPLEWGGLALGGEVFEVDQAASAASRCVLASVNAAVEYVVGGIGHVCVLYGAQAPSLRAHWCPVEYVERVFLDGEGVVVLDWHEVYLGHGPHSETERFADRAAARADFVNQCEYLEDFVRHLDEQQDAEDEFVN